ncbi:DUF924 domain-containing protein [Erythrobacteraceae bacterium WH01K]|nr:DUF924 domain-containing protein [Erythrobacteraceae bacterium WH01K]
MALARRDWASEVLRIWFGVLGPADWFGGADAVDRLLERRFSSDWQQLRHRPPGEFLIDPPTTLGAIILFDQVPRNLFGGTAKAFASDPLALALSHAALRRGWHRAVASEEIQFLAMPLMHSEDRADQRLCVEIFARHVPGALSFARSHKAMIDRFGRFPHRNEMLGRTTTPAEQRAIDAGFSW